MEDPTESKSSSHIPIKPVPSKPSECPSSVKKTFSRLSSTDLKSNHQPLVKPATERPKSPEKPSESTETTESSPDKNEAESKPKKKRGKKKKKKVIEDVGYYDDLQIIKELSPKKKTLPPNGNQTTFKSNAAEFIYSQILELKNQNEQPKTCFNITVCPICKKTFWESEQYSQHMESEHSQDKDEGKL